MDPYGYISFLFQLTILRDPREMGECKNAYTKFIYIYIYISKLCTVIKIWYILYLCSFFVEHYTIVNTIKVLSITKYLLEIHNTFKFLWVQQHFNSILTAF